MNFRKLVPTFPKKSLILANKDRLHPQFDFCKANHYCWPPIIFDKPKYSSIEWGFSGIPQNLSFFGEKNSKIPKVKLIPVPKISPKIFWGFSGIKPQKNSKFNLPSSPKNPQNFSKPCPRPRPIPEIRGRGRGKSGIGAPFPHPTLYYDNIENG